jgi:hypothetical protein
MLLFYLHKIDFFYDKCYNYCICSIKTKQASKGGNTHATDR